MLLDFGSTTDRDTPQTTANYLVSLLSVYDIGFPGGIDNNNVKWRALIWAVSEGFFFVSISMNFLPCA